MKLLAFSLCLINLMSCTKQQQSVPTVVKNSFEPEKVILETTLDLPTKYKSKVKASDRLLWDVKNGNGQLIAADMQILPKFPYQIVLKARNVGQPLKPEDKLMFSARIVKVGDEFNPPAKGQLTVLVGVGKTEREEPVVEPKLSKKAIANFTKKNKDIIRYEDLVVGSKITASFEPTTF